jgi:citrate synthase
MSSVAERKPPMANAKLTIGDKEVDLPIVVGSEDEMGIDVGKLRGQTGMITLDPGYVNTGSTESAITYLDGENGVLRYRGYPIEVLAANCDFVEVSYLLIYGELPSTEQLTDFRMAIRRHSMLHEEMRSFYNGFPRDAPRQPRTGILTARRRQQQIPRPLRRASSDLSLSRSSN